MPTVLKINSTGTQAYALNSRDRTIDVVDLATYAIRTISGFLDVAYMDVGIKQPVLYVSDKVNNSVLVVNIASGTIVKVIVHADIQQPERIVVSPNGVDVYVTCAGPKTVKFAAESYSYISTFLRSYWNFIISRSSRYIHSLTVYSNNYLSYTYSATTGNAAFSGDTYLIENTYFALHPMKDVIYSVATSGRIGVGRDIIPANLGYIEARTGLSVLAVTSDGARLYAVRKSTNTIVIFSI